MILTIKRLLRGPGYFALLVGVLAAGLGAGLGLYSIADSILFRALPIAEPGKVFRVLRVDEQREMRNSWSLPLAREQLAESELFENVAWYADWLQFTWKQGDQRHTLEAAVVSEDYFTLVGITPAAGRFLRPEDDVQGNAPVAVISHALWRSRFNLDEGIIGSSLRLNDQPVTIVGVAPPGFSGASLSKKLDLWLPVSTGGPMGMGGFDPEMLLNTTGMTWLDVLVRLAPGKSIEEVRAVFGTRIIPDAFPADRFLFMDARLAAVDPAGTGSFLRVAWLLLALVAVIVIVACADAAGFMLVRAEAERGVAAVKFSVGASRWRLLREIAAESLVVTALAAGIGLAAATVLSQWLLVLLGKDLPLPPHDAFDLFAPRILAAYFLMLTATTVLTASAALWRFTRIPLNESLSANNGNTAGSGLRELIVGFQVALSVTLIACTFMFTGALRDTLSTDPGFDVEGRATAHVNLLALGGWGDVYAPILEALRNDPRIEHAALAGIMPLAGHSFAMTATLEGSVTADTVTLSSNPVSDGFFETLDIAIVEGRDFPPSGGEAQAFAIVNRALAEKYWPGQSPLGRYVKDFSDEPLEIIGIVENHKHQDLREDPQPILYVPQEAMLVSTMGIVAAASDSTTAIQAIREITRDVDPEIAIERLEPLAASIERVTARDRAMTLLAAMAAAFATLLAAGGMYATAAYSVRQRQREIGLRYALGASRRDVVLRFLRKGTVIVIAGSVAGALVAWLVTMQVQSLVAGAERAPAFILYASLAFVAIALLANVIPAWRGVRLQPMDVLRDE